MPDLIALQRTTLQLLDQAKNVKEIDCDLDNRTCEFLLLVQHLSTRIKWPVQRALEIGCGAGYSLRLWSEIAGSITGIDSAKVLSGTRKVLSALPPARNNITLIESTAEDFLDQKKYDLILSQYVLEHVQDQKKALDRIHDNLMPGGLAIHVLNGTPATTAWYITYRQRTSFPRRIYHSLRETGLLRTLRNPFVYTPPHEPKFGDYAYELDQYRLDSWGIRLLRAEFEIIDWFQTSDINHVFVTRSIRL